MKTAQYVRQEKNIAAADSGGIRERWLWGLRLLRDVEKMASAKSLRHGAADELITAAKSAGRKLSAREIQRRLQCARTYPTESQIRHAVADFETWRDLADAGFPPYEAPDGEAPADYRTEGERRHDHARALADLLGDQGALFPLSEFEPIETTLKDLQTYMEEQEGITARFQARGKKRREYFERLVEAADFDLEVTWQEAHSRLGDGAEIGELS